MSYFTGFTFQKRSKLEKISSTPAFTLHLLSLIHIKGGFLISEFISGASNSKRAGSLQGESLLALTKMHNPQLLKKVWFFFQRKETIFWLSLLWENLTSIVTIYRHFQAQFTYLFNKAK